MQLNSRTISVVYRSAGDNEGFSLVELLVVLAIMGLIAAIATPQVLGYLDSAKVTTAKAQIKNFGNALEFYYLDAGTYPTSDQGLAALAKKPDSAANWNGPYIKGVNVMLDPWGTPYQYKSPGQDSAFAIISLGKDKKLGGTGSSADILSE